MSGRLTARARTEARSETAHANGSAWRAHAVVAPPPRTRKERGGRDDDVSCSRPVRVARLSGSNLGLP